MHPQLKRAIAITAALERAANENGHPSPLGPALIAKAIHLRVPGRDEREQLSNASFSPGLVSTRVLPDVPTKKSFELDARVLVGQGGVVLVILPKLNADENPEPPASRMKEELAALREKLNRAEARALIVDASDRPLPKSMSLELNAWHAATGLEVVVCGANGKIPPDLTKGAYPAIDREEGLILLETRRSTLVPKSEHYVTFDLLQRPRFPGVQLLEFQPQAKVPEKDYWHAAREDLRRLASNTHGAFILVTGPKDVLGTPGAEFELSIFANQIERRGGTVCFSSYGETKERVTFPHGTKSFESRRPGLIALAAEAALPQIAAPSSGWSYVERPRYDTTIGAFTVRSSPSAANFAPRRQDDLVALDRDIEALSAETDNRILFEAGADDPRKDVVTRMIVELQSRFNFSETRLVAVSADPRIRDSLNRRGCPVVESQVQGALYLRYPVVPPSDGWERINFRYTEDNPGTIEVFASRPVIFADTTKDNRDRVGLEIKALARSGAKHVVVNATGSQGTLLTSVVAEFRSEYASRDTNLIVVSDIPKAREALRMAFSRNSASIHKCNEEAQLEIRHGVKPPFSGWEIFSLLPVQMGEFADPALRVAFSVKLVGRNAIQGRAQHQQEFSAELAALGRSPLSVLLQLPPQVHPPFIPSITNELMALRSALSNKGLELVLFAHHGTNAKSNVTNGGFTIFHSQLAAVNHLRSLESIAVI